MCVRTHAQSAPLQFPPQSTPGCRSLVCLLLERDPRHRLGAGPHDVGEVKRHAFFKNLDWQLLLQKNVKPIYRPSVKNEYDTSNFDEQFTNESVAAGSHGTDSKQPLTASHNHSDAQNAQHEDGDDEDMFDDFSFIPNVDDDDGRLGINE